MRSPSATKATAATNNSAAVNPAGSQIAQRGGRERTGSSDPACADPSVGTAVERDTRIRWENATERRAPTEVGMHQIGQKESRIQSQIGPWADGGRPHLASAQRPSLLLCCHGRISCCATHAKYLVFAPAPQSVSICADALRHAF